MVKYCTALVINIPLTVLPKETPQVYFYQRLQGKAPFGKDGTIGFNWGFWSLLQHEDQQSVENDPRANLNATGRIILCEGVWVTASYR